MFTNKKRGSVLVDAAICIPVFLIAMMLILGLIVQAGKEAKAYASLVEIAEASLFSESSEEVTLPGFAKDASFQICYRPWSGESDREYSETVYVFPKYGEKYHKSGCMTMDRYPENYIPMPKEDAVADGYLPCLVCIGAENNE